MRLNYTTLSIAAFQALDPNLNDGEVPLSFTFVAAPASIPAAGNPGGIPVVGNATSNVALVGNNTFVTVANSTYNTTSPAHGNATYADIFVVNLPGEAPGQNATAVTISVAPTTVAANAAISNSISTLTTLPPSTSVPVATAAVVTPPPSSTVNVINGAALAAASSSSVAAAEEEASSLSSASAASAQAAEASQHAAERASASSASVASAQAAASAEAKHAAESSSRAAAAAAASSSSAAAAEAAASSSSSSSSGSGSSGGNDDGGEITGGVGTFYLQNGVAGACGQVNPDSAQICALQTVRYNNGANCGRQIRITNLNTGGHVVATVADECPTCDNENSVDMSVGTFTAIATEEQGEVPIAWEFI
jgi:hypothetical protein